MARIYPVLSEAALRALPSAAEATTYRVLRDSLGDGYVVIHGRSFIARHRQGGHQDGEADFTIFSATGGLLTVEIKGGGIRFDPSMGWESVDRAGRVHSIKNPIAQAKSQKFALFECLKGDPSGDRYGDEYQSGMQCCSRISILLQT